MFFHDHRESDHLFWATVIARISSEIMERIRKFPDNICLRIEVDVFTGTGGYGSYIL